jgi:pheromone a factor receptor
MAIYAFYKRRQTHMRLMSSPNRGRYLRLMAISFIEILGTIPMGTYYIAAVVKEGVIPWKGWARMHSHYSEVVQVAGFIWRNDPKMSFNAELGRWSLVLCAFIFFALFGFAGEAREHYRRLYQSLARRIGKSTSTLRGAPLACVVVVVCPYSPGFTSFNFFAVLHQVLMRRETVASQTLPWSK